MQCPYCRVFVEKGKRTCPSCGYSLEPERRLGDRRKTLKPPPGGIERRKRKRRRRSSPIGLGF